MMEIITQVLNETEGKLRKKVRDCQEIINHFTDPIPNDNDFDDYLQYAKIKKQYFEDHMENGKYSLEAIQKAYDTEAEYERQLRELANIRYICDNYIKKGGE